MLEAGHGLLIVDGVLEIGMLEGLLGSDPLLGVDSKHLGE